MNIFSTQKWQYGQKIKRQFLLSFIASMSMMSLRAQCTPMSVNVPYAENFESSVIPAIPECTLAGVISGDGSVSTCSGTENGFTGKFLCFRNNPGTSVSSIAMTFFARPLNLNEGGTYRLSYDYGTNVLNGKKLLVFAENELNGLVQIGSHDVINPGRSSHSLTFTALSSDMHYLIFRAVQESESEDISEFVLNLDNITVVVVIPPTISNLTSVVNCGQSTLLTIDGTYLENATVTIGGTPIALATNTASQITATISTAMSGPVVVTTPDGTVTGASNFTFTPAPVIVAGASLTGNITITATPAGQAYQWINCTTNAPVGGVTGSVFTAAANGSYKVVVTNAGGCKDTSDCVNVSKVGLSENSMDIGVSLYPNPTEGNLYIAMTETEQADIVVFDALGKVVFTMNNIQHGEVIDMNHTQKGIYLVKVFNAKGANVFRMEKKQ